MTAGSRRHARSEVHRRGASFLIVSGVLLLATACPSFGPTKIACDADEHCPSGMRCGDQRLCVEDRADVDGGDDPDGGGGDAGSDSGAPDGGDLLDGGPDAGSDGGADGGGDGGTDAGSSFCDTVQPAPYFCDDFDDGVLDPRWEPNTPQNASVQLDQAVSLSAPASLLARVNVGVSQPTAHLQVSNGGGQSVTRRVVRADVRVESLDPAGHRAVILRNGVGDESVYLTLYDSGSELYEHRAQSVPQIQLPPLPLDTWTRVELEFVAGSPSRVTVRYAGIDVLKDHEVGLQSGADSDAWATAGLFVNGNTTNETRVRFDNFVFQLEP